ncbi:methyltransferase [Cristinia sonorae]|uniref:tRNA N(3)-methylcytidine methyltransferase n=1 Tax=Cristinia sonorae TaxID=1940300 RepID=A0A8K0UWF4_9AGAR|nr:methyltransferase [Cristinia sonorae]
MNDTAEPSTSSGSKSRTASSVHDIHAEKPPFGSRFLTEEADVWSQNAWDHVPAPEGQEEVIATALARQHISPVPEVDKAKYNEKPAKHWDNFYKMNSSNFFRNRKWLQLEFPELVAATTSGAGEITIAELGCGAGNAVFPLLSENRNPNLHLHAYDYSSQAVKLVQNNPLYLLPPVGTIQSAVWDLSSSSLPPNVEPGSVDIIILVFVLSALHPSEWCQAIQNVYKMLKPGGHVLFRDYGRYDLTQLRFKSGRLLEDNFYIRGDKTRVYFFELDELALLFTGASVPSTMQTTDTTTQEEEHESGPAANDASRAQSPLSPERDTRTPTLSTPSIHPILQQPSSLKHPLFSIEQLGVDRRLIVNRKRQLKMYRVWMQGKFQKIES